MRSETRPLLGTIRCVIHAIADLAATEDAYVGTLGYVRVGVGEIDATVAASWGAPALTGRKWLALAPASGEAVHLLFVEEPASRNWQALTTHGWNATEIVVQDVETLAARLVDSPFRILFPPRGLTRFPMIRAMQVLGPSGECLYFTEIGEGSGLDLAAARSFVGRVFIAVAGGADLDAMFARYEGFANVFDAPVATPVRVISWANDLPLETDHAHGLIKLPFGTLIELDAYPAMTKARATPRGSLPLGMAAVAFEVETLPDLAYLGPPAPLPCGLPGIAASLRGAAGEWIQLLAVGATDSLHPETRVAA